MDLHEVENEYLKGLNCHFTWNLYSTCSSSSTSCDVNVLEEKLRLDFADNPSFTCQAYLLLSFAFAVGDVNEKCDYKKALFYIELAESHAKSNAEKYLVVANKLWILNTKGDSGENQSLLESVEKFEQEFTDIDKSDISLIEAFSLSRFPPDGNEKALDKYKEAVTLNPNNGEAYFGIGQILGRLRRMHHGPISKPSDEELNAFEKSMKLWPDNPLPFVFYALVLSYDVRRGSNAIEQTIKKMDKYMELAMSKADRFGSAGSSVVFKSCTKGYRKICGSGQMPKHQYLYYLGKQKECVDKAVELSPNDSSVLHAAGIFYFRVNPHKSVKKAEDYLMRSVECSPFRLNFWAELNLVLLRREQRTGYDVFAAFGALETKYSGPGQDHRYLANVHQYIAMEYESLKEYDNARKEYVKSLSYDPNCHQIWNTAENLPKLVEQFVEKSTDCFNSDTISKYVHLEHLFEGIQTYEMFCPKKINEAKNLYERVLRLDGTNTEARKSLCDILLELKLYDKCLEEASQLDPDEKDQMLCHARGMKAHAHSTLNETGPCSKPDSTEGAAN